MENAPPRVVILGAGRMGQHHLAAALRNRHLCPVGFLEPQSERREVLERRFGLPGYETPDELFDACTPDCAIVSTPDRHHAEHANACLDRGIPTLVEKPLCADPASARRLAASFEASGIHLAVGAVERFNPAWHAFATAILERGDLSELRIVRRGGVPRDASSGVAYDLAVHDLDLLCTWLSTRELPLPQHIECRTSALTTAFRIGHLVVDLVASWGGGSPERTWTALCGSGTGCVDFARRTASWSSHAGETTPLPVSEDDPLELEHAAFAAAIRTGAAPGLPELAAHLQALDLCQILSAPIRPSLAGGSGV